MVTAGCWRWLVAAGALAIAGCSAGDPPDPDAAASTPRPAAAGDPAPPSSPAAVALPDGGVGTAPAGRLDTGDVDPDEHVDAQDTDGEEHDAERSEANDAALDALEQQFEAQGVKDIRGDPVNGVTIRLEDELTIADAAAVCAAVRAAGFASVSVDVDDVAAPCP
jgi:hypothetical protein